MILENETKATTNTAKTNNNMRYLTFALCKGRLAKKTLELLEQIGRSEERRVGKECM